MARVPDWLLDARRRIDAQSRDPQLGLYGTGYRAGCRVALKTLPPYVIDPTAEDWRAEGFDPPCGECEFPLCARMRPCCKSPEANR